MSETFSYLARKLVQELQYQAEIDENAGFDPMYLTLRGAVTTEGFRRVIPAGSYGYLPPGALGPLPQNPTTLLDGPVPINPRTMKPWDAIRITALNETPTTFISPSRGVSPAPIFANVTPNNLQGSFGALIRVTGGSSSRGGRATREIAIGGAQEAALEVGELENVKVEMLYATADTVVQWQWFDDSTGVIAKTPIFSRLFVYTFAAPSIIVAAPEGSVRMWVDSDVLIGWNQTTFGVAGAGLNPRYTGLNNGKGVGGLQPIPTSSPITVLTPYFTLQAAAGSPWLDTNILFELSPF